MTPSRQLAPTLGLSGVPHMPVPAELVEVIRSFPLKREVEHCGVRFEVPSFDFYAQCPRCATRLKVRSFSGVPEIEDLFAAFFEWMNQPGAEEIITRRRAELHEDEQPETASKKWMCGS